MSPTTAQPPHAAESSTEQPQGTALQRIHVFDLPKRLSKRHEAVGDENRIRAAVEIEAA